MGRPSIRRTKIICTIGPASDNEGMLRRLIHAGMNVARLNFSHGSHAEHGAKIKLIRKLSRELGRPVAIMQDLAGPKIRVGEIEGQGVRLHHGHELILTTHKVKGTEARVSVNYSRLHEEVQDGDRILLADGALELEVLRVCGHDIYCRVIIGGVLNSHKGVNITSETLRISGMTIKDKKDLVFGIGMGVDFVAMSFVRRPEDIQEAKRMIGRAGRDIPVIAKIEKPEAVRNIEAILTAADGLMVARGDLGVEIPLEEIPGVQKMLIRKANALGKPVITATQMLRSMVDSPRPTRAEVTDVANAILDGTDAVMLSEESAVGKYPVAAVKMLHNIALQAEIELFRQSMIRPPYEDIFPTIPAAISYAAYLMSHDLAASAIVTPTMTGSTTRLISRYRPRAPIIALCPSEKTVRRLCLVFAALPVYIPHLKDSSDIFAQITAAVQKTRLLRRHDRMIITAGLPLYKSGSTNLIKVVEM